LEINGAILEVIALTRGEIVKNGVSVQTQLAECLPLIQGDRVQLQPPRVTATSILGIDQRSRQTPSDSFGPKSPAPSPLQ
jgi:hypothetical protein